MANPAVNAEELSPRDLIMEIRCRYYKPRDNDDPYCEIARGTLPLVTEELYESQTHFFSELLQNADDNDYPEEVTPSLIVEAHDDRIEVINNEIGFRPHHVRAICSVAKSTKRYRKETTTGEKGIGFKAVFQVTNTPEVHSGGFHFRFDKERDPEFGMVIPEWIDEAEETIQGTRIVLPLNCSYRLPNDFFKSMQPELLLFLRRIRRLEFRDVNYEKSVALARFDAGGVATVTRTITDDVESKNSSEHAHSFFIHRYRVEMSDIDEHRRSQITATEVAVALPLDDSGNVTMERRRRTLFAFLPVKETELAFLCHGDFVLSTSRESIREDLPWNQAVRNSLGTCLAEAILACQNSESLGATALRCLQEPNKVHDEFLRPIVEGAIQRLKADRCIPLADGGWGLPEDTIAPDNAGLWKLVSSAELNDRLGLAYADPNIDGVKLAFPLLGVRTFRLEDLLKCLEDQSWRESRTPEWWADFYVTLGQMQLSTERLKLLRAAPILPLSRGEVVFCDSGMVFRSLSRDRHYGFSDELNILDPHVLSAVDEEMCEHLDSFLQRLGVTDATPTKIIDKHILPMHSGDEWSSLTQVVLFEHVRYIRDHLDEYRRDKQEVAIRTLGGTLRLKSTESDEVSDFEVAHELYLGAAYDDPHDLESLFGRKIESMRISPEYGELAESGRATGSEWCHFFRAIGANTLPRVLKTGDRKYLWSDESLECLHDGGSSRQDRFLELVAQYWKGQYSRWAAWRPSPLLNELMQAEVRSTSGEIVNLSSCYLRTESNVAVFGDSVPFVAYDLPNEFAEAVGIVTEPTVEHALSRLRELKEEEVVDTEPVGKLYKFLDSRYDQHKQLIDVTFESDGLILAEGGESRDWVPTSEARWSVPPHFRRYSDKKSLSGLWRDLQGFLVDRVGVKAGLTPNDLVELLARMAQDDGDDEFTSKVVIRIYQSLADEVKNDRGGDWLKRLQTELLLYTTKGQWWRNDDDVFLADDEPLARLFDQSDDVAFLAVPRESQTRLAPLLDALNVRLLSDVIVTTVPEEITATAWPALEAIMQERFRMVVRFLHHKHSKYCEDAIENGRLNALRHLTGQVCSPLELIVKLGENIVQHKFDARLVADSERFELFIDENCKEDWKTIGIELGRLLQLADTESLPLASLLGDSEDEAMRLLSTLKVPELPPELGQTLFGDEVDEWDPQQETEEQGLNTTPQAGEVTPSLGEELGESTPAGTDAEAEDKPAPVGDEAPIQRAINNKHEEQESDERVEEDGREPSSRGKPEKDSVLARCSRGTDDSTTHHETDATTRMSDGTEREPDDEESDTESMSTGAPGRPKEPAGSNTVGRGVGRAPADSFEGRNTSRGDGSVRPPTAPKAPSRKRSQRSASPSDNRERLRSYVAPEDDSSGEASDPNARKKTEEIEAAAIEFVLAYEEREGRRAQDVNENSPHNKGYDILSKSSAGDTERFIEVKGVAGAWGNRGVMVTPSQFEFAREHGDKSWLYIVEYAIGPAPQLHRIQNFARRIWRFGFDDGWQAVEEIDHPDSTSKLPTPSVGLRIRLKDGRQGVIEDIYGSGRLMGVRVRLTSGEKMRARWATDAVSIAREEGEA